MAIFQYGFSHAESCTAVPGSHGILAFRRNLQARLFFGKSKTCSSGNFGDAGWWHSSILVAPGCFAVVSFTLGVGRGQEHQSVMAGSGGTIASSWWTDSLRLTVSRSFSLLVLETPAPGRQPLHHTDLGGGGRGQHAEGSILTPEQTLALRPPLWWKPKQQPWSHKVHCISLSTRCSQGSLALSVSTQWLSIPSLARTQKLAPQTRSN